MQQTTIQTSIPPTNPYQGRMIFGVPYMSSPVATNYRNKQSLGLGATMITVGILCIIFNIVALILTSGGYYGAGNVSFVGHGIWCGILFIITGSLGVSAAKTKSKCMIVTFMVFCILSCFMCISLLTLGLVGATMSSSQYTDCYNSNYGYNSYYPYYSAPYCSGTNAKYNGVLAMEACLAIMAVIQAVVAIWSAAICCRAVCCCAGPQPGMVYNTPPYNANSQVMIINQQQQQTGQPLMAAPYGTPMYPGYPMANQWGYSNMGTMVSNDLPPYNLLLATPTGAPPPVYDNPGMTLYNGPPPQFQAPPPQFQGLPPQFQEK